MGASEPRSSLDPCSLISKKPGWCHSTQLDFHDTHSKLALILVTVAEGVAAQPIVCRKSVM